MTNIRDPQYPSLLPRRWSRSKNGCAGWDFVKRRSLRDLNGSG